MTVLTRLAARLLPGLVADHAAAPPLGEVATTKDGRDITRGYVDTLDLLGPSDYLLLGRAGGDYQIYEQLQTDPQVQTGLMQRKKALVSKEWEVLPGKRRGQYSKAKAKQAAESLQAMLEDLGGESDTDAGEQAQPMPGWDAVSEVMLHGIFPGFGVGECLWQRDGREVVLDRVAVRKSRRFGFAPDGAIRLITSANPLGEALPRQKFWSFTNHNDCTDDPYGLGLAHWLYWPVYFKRADLKVWLTFLDKLGLPTTIGEFPTNATPAQQNKLLAAVRAVRSDSGIIIPQGMVVRLLEAARSGTADYAALHQVMDAAISKVLVGHSAAADATPGRLGGEDRANAVADTIIKADADLICGSFNVGPARWLTAWNFGDTVPAPQVWRRIASEPDLKPLAERDRIIMDLAAGCGQRLTVAYLTDTYDVELEPTTDPDPAPPAAPGAPAPTDRAAPPAAGLAERVRAALRNALTPSADHAEPAVPDPQDQITAAEPDPEAYQAAAEELLAPILTALADGLTPEQILARLDEWYGALDDAALTDLLERGVAAADALGRLEVDDETADAPAAD